MDTTAWKLRNRIKLQFKSAGYSITLSAKNNRLFCCSLQDAVIHIYSLSGELLQTHGKPGHRAAGRLCSPYICKTGDADDDGSVLIVDLHNNRLQVMNERGKFRVLHLEPPVLQPRSAVLFNNFLYVVSLDNTIFKYSLSS